MQLTGRGLTLALGACLVGGIGFGIVTTAVSTLSPSSAVVSTAPASATTSSTTDTAELGDQMATYPLPTSTEPSPLTVTATPTIAPTPTSTPSPTPSTAASTVSTTTASAAASRIVASPDSARQPTQIAGTRVGSSRKANPQTRPTTPRSSKPSAASSSTAASAPSVTKPLDGWRPPALGVGTTDITAPRLTSGADAGTVIVCGPSSACTLTGGSLTISADAASVTVTWSAPKTRSHLAWLASTDWSRS